MSRTSLTKGESIVYYFVPARRLAKFGQKTVKISHHIPIWLEIFSIFCLGFCQPLKLGVF